MKYSWGGIFLFIILTLPLSVSAKELCIYVSTEGKTVQVRGRDRVPVPFRQAARCFAERHGTHLARPEDIELSGSIRRERLSTSVGDVELRWPRSAERLFGRTPLRAMADAARTVSRVLKQSGFPMELRLLDQEWQVIFLDAELPATQIPAYLIQNCHPGWMTPPSNIYLVAQRVAGACYGRKPRKARVNDGELAQVILHEMGHAIEYRLLGRAWRRDRMRAEGFACWFEQFASDFSAVMRDGVVREKYLKLARRSFAEQPNTFHFRGTGPDYARAALYFHAIVDRSGVRRLMRVYESMREKNLDFFSAVDDVLGWNRDRLEREVRKQL